MRDAINFDDELAVERHEIDDITVDAMLSSEFPTRQLSISQRLPEQSLCAGLRGPQLASPALELLHPLTLSQCYAPCQRSEPRSAPSPRWGEGWREGGRFEVYRETFNPSPGRCAADLSPAEV